MIIGIDVSRANRGQKTGVEWYAYNLVQHLKQVIPENIRVILYSDQPLRGPLASLPINWKTKVLRWPPKRLWTQFRLSWEMLFHSPDVLLVPAHVYPLIHPKKTIMTVHDVAAAHFPQTYNRFERWYSLWAGKTAVKNLWRVIVPSRFTKEELLRLFGDENSGRVKVIYHGYDLQYKRIENQDEIKPIFKRIGIDKTYILTIGRLEQKKNTERLIKAFDLVRQKKDLQLLLVGKPGYGHQAVSQAIADSHYADDIVRAGWVEEENLPALISGAAAFVFPSLYEGFGLPLLEAMACGTPLVISKTASLREVAGNCALRANAQSESDMAEKLLRVLDDGKLSNTMIACGLDRVKQFSWRKCAQKTWQLIVEN